MRRRAILPLLLLLAGCGARDGHPAEPAGLEGGSRALPARQTQLTTGRALPAERADPKGDVLAFTDEGSGVRRRQASRLDLTHATVRRDGGRVFVDVALVGTLDADEALDVRFSGPHGTNATAQVTGRSRFAKIASARASDRARGTVRRTAHHVLLDLPGAPFARADDWSVTTFGPQGIDLIAGRRPTGATHDTEPEITVIR